MLDINKAYFCLFCIMLLGLLLGSSLVQFIDELCLLLFFLLAVLDMLYNKAWRKYKVLFALGGVMAFFLMHSLLFSPFNTKYAMVNDFMRQLKPLAAFAVSYAIAPSFTAKQKKAVRVMCVALSGLSLGIIGLVLINAQWFDMLLWHVYYQGLLCLGCALAYMLVAYDKDKPKGYSKQDLFWIVLILTLGLACTRAKYYGVFVISVYILFWYKPGVLNLKNWKNLLAVSAIGGAVLMVSWSKIDYYFIHGELGEIDLDVMSSYARAALYMTAVLIFMDFPVMGSGLASFATASSGTSVNYSSLYGEYGIDNVYGLSQMYDAFITDTFYPEFAQFGLVGVLCFLAFLWWLWRRLRVVLRTVSVRMFSIGCIGLAFLLIDATSSCSVFQASGELTMSIVGIILATTKGKSRKEIKGILSKDINELNLNN